MSLYTYIYFTDRRQSDSLKVSLNLNILVWEIRTWWNSIYNPLYLYLYFEPPETKAFKITLVEYLFCYLPTLFEYDKLIALIALSSTSDYITYLKIMHKIFQMGISVSVSFPWDIKGLI